MSVYANIRDNFFPKTEKKTWITKSARQEEIIVISFFFVIVIIYQCL